jgi:hypothetical protein
MTQEYTLDLALDDAREHLVRAADRLGQAQMREIEAQRACGGDDAELARRRFSALSLGALRAEVLQLMGRLP